MESLLLVFAFVFGYGVYRIGLPPLVGYLIAGFVLKFAGVEISDQLVRVGELGVTLLLFSIGLKLRVKSLVKPEIWAGTTLHSGITVLVFGMGLFLMSLAGVPVLNSLTVKSSFIVAFALCFSSTVFVVKILEERGEMTSLHGRVAIGMLIMQDIFAVLFMAFSEGSYPSLLAPPFLISLLIIRPLLMKIMDRIGHRELLLLFGVILALGIGAKGFKMVGMKADLGALIAGILIARHEKAGELSDVLMSFKDLFLVGFFLTIGMSGLPGVSDVLIATALAVVVCIKSGLFVFLLTRFHLRPRTAFLSALSLSNYSEFGLMVGAVAVKNGWIGNEWLIILAVAMSISFAIASPVNASAHMLYDRYSGLLKRFSPKRLHPDDQPADPGDATIVIFGMSRLGLSAYDHMYRRHGDTVVGVDYDSDTVKRLKASGRNIILGDATDSDFWKEAIAHGSHIKLALLSMESLTENTHAAGQLLRSGYNGIIAAVARYDDEVEELKKLGVHAAYNIYSEAGAGFADHTCEVLEHKCKIFNIS